MHHRTAVSLVLLCLVATAGCLGYLRPDSAEPTLDDVTFPPGVSESGTNVTALAAGHTATLENRSFTYRVEMEEPNESGTMEARIDAGRNRLLVHTNTSDGRRAVYLTEESEYEKRVSDGETAYEVRDRTPAWLSMVPISYTGASIVEQFAGPVNYTATGVETVDGTALLVLTANESDLESGSDSVELRSYDGRILVDEAGRIHSFAVDFEAEYADGTTSALSIEMTISDVGSTAVPEPDWLDEARRSAGN